jgi:hypothetical protein
MRRRRRRKFIDKTERDKEVRLTPGGGGGRGLSVGYCIHTRGESGRRCRQHDRSDTPIPVPQ